MRKQNRKPLLFKQKPKKMFAHLPLFVAIQSSGHDYRLREMDDLDST